MFPISVSSFGDISIVSRTYLDQGRKSPDLSSYQLIWLPDDAAFLFNVSLMFLSIKGSNWHLSTSVLKIMLEVWFDHQDGHLDINLSNKKSTFDDSIDVHPIDGWRKERKSESE